MSFPFYFGLESKNLCINWNAPPFVFISLFWVARATLLVHGYRVRYIQKEGERGGEREREEEKARARDNTHGWLI